jgi:hypothetical protein
MTSVDHTTARSTEGRCRVKTRTCPRGYKERLLIVKRGDQGFEKIMTSLSRAAKVGLEMLLFRKPVLAAIEAQSQCWFSG